MAARTIPRTTSIVKAVGAASENSCCRAINACASPGRVKVSNARSAMSAMPMSPKISGDSKRASTTERATFRIV